MKKNDIIRAYLLIILIVGMIGCKKADFLNTIPDNSLTIPKSLTDYQKLLDNDIIMNGGGGNGITSSLTETGSDEYFVFGSDFATMGVINQNEYVWNSNPYPGTIMQDWDMPYRCVLYANTVLDGISKINSLASPEAYNNCKGSALFFRAHAFYQLAQVFAPEFDDASATTDLGIPLRLSSDLNEKIHRSSVLETYNQIINDLNSSIRLLPVTPLYKTRPSKPAAYALLARVYLSMRNYPKSGLYADSCLQLSNKLLDYNSLNFNSVSPIPLFSSEDMFYSIVQLSFPVQNYGYTDSTLYASYDKNDLRTKVFFQLYNGLPYFVSNYGGAYNMYGGLATDEIYLIRAECNARGGNTSAAMVDLNKLLKNRYVTGTYTDLAAANADDALDQILRERRKELCFRGLRWTDLRRLNKESRFATTLKRVINGQTYTLPPNDLRYTWLIPDNVLSFNPGMPQNPR